MPDVAGFGGAASEGDENTSSDMSCASRDASSTKSP